MTARNMMAKLAEQRDRISDLEDNLDRLSEWIDDARYSGGPPEVRYTTTDDYRWVDPQYETDGAAAFDLRSTEQVHRPHETATPFLVGTGLKFAIPTGYVGIVAIRSSISDWLTLANGIGVIDSDYRGEVKLKLDCHLKDGPLEPGMRLAQMMVVPCTQANLIKAESLDSTERGDDGFGSTGK